MKNVSSVFQYNPNEKIFEYSYLMSEKVILEKEKLDNNSNIRQFLDDSMQNIDSENQNANILESDNNESNEEVVMLRVAPS